MSELKPEELVEIRGIVADSVVHHVTPPRLLALQDGAARLLAHEATLRAKLADAAAWRRQAELELKHYGAELAYLASVTAERDKLIAEWAGRLAKDLVVAGEIESATIPTLDAAELAGMAEREAERRGWHACREAIATLADERGWRLLIPNVVDCIRQIEAERCDREGP